jgi:cytochrome c553
MRPYLLFVSLLSLQLCALANLARADGLAIALHGNNRGAAACVSCHGAHGEGVPENGFPRLAGLNAAYLRAQLDAFANGQRSNTMMPAIAQALSHDERVAVANYYADLSDSPTMPQPIAAMNSAGERLAVQGRWSQSLPACMQCHGALGSGVGSGFPALAGQSSLYIENQLRAWQQGTRAAGPLGLMKVVASRLTVADVREVALYFSALPPSATSRRSRP